MTIEDRVALLENQVHEIYDMLEQIAKDIDLLSVNIMRTLKGIQPQKPQSQDTRQHTWNPMQITWKPETGFKGLYEKSDDVNSTDFKALLKDLADHKGTLTRDNCFYWSFPNGATVGRRVTQK